MVAPREWDYVLYPRLRNSAHWLPARKKLPSSRCSSVGLCLWQRFSSGPVRLDKSSYCIGHLLMRQPPLIKIIMPIINPLYSFQLVIQAPLRHITGHTFRSREAAEGAAQVVNGEMLQIAILFGGCCFRPASRPNSFEMARFSVSGPMCGRLLARRAGKT